MALVSERLRRRVEEIRKDLATMTPEECFRVAAMARDAKPRLETQRQRELAEEIAQGFEQRAAAEASLASP